MKNHVFSLLLSTTLCTTTCPVFAMELLDDAAPAPAGIARAFQEVDFAPTGLAVSFTKHSNNHLEIITDDNNGASYQGVSSPYTVTPGQILNVEYDIVVKQGIMSLGALNTMRNGWYFNEMGTVGEVIHTVGDHKGSIKWVVPADEKEISLVLRNYHLGTAGQSIFIVKTVKMGIETKYHLSDEKGENFGTIDLFQSKEKSFNLSCVRFERDYNQTLANFENRYSHLKKDMWSDELQERQLAAYFLHKLPTSTLQLKRSDYQQHGIIEYMGIDSYDDDKFHVRVHVNTEMRNATPSLFFEWAYRGIFRNDNAVTTASPRVRFLLKRGASSV